MFIGEPRFLHDPNWCRPVGHTLVAGPSVPGAADHCRSCHPPGSTRPGGRRARSNRFGSVVGAASPTPQRLVVGAGCSLGRRLRRLKLTLVGLPRVEHAGVARIHRRFGLRRPTAGGGTAMEDRPPHVDGEHGKQRPLEDIRPAQSIPAERAPDLEPEGDPAHGQPHRQRDVHLGGVKPRKALSPVRRPLVRHGRDRVRCAGSSISVRGAGCVHRDPPYRGPRARTPGWRAGPEASRAQLTVRTVALVAVPYLEVTTINPTTALVGTVTKIWVADSDEIAAFLPPMVTFLATPRPDPVMVIVPPRATGFGANEVIDGAEWKGLALVAEPAAVVTARVPSAAPTGTIAVTEVVVSAVMVPGVPAKETAVAPPRLTPVIVTEEPAAALAGLNEVMDGE